jgi:hypothetical protein
MTMTKHLMDMSAEELAQIKCGGFWNNPCDNNMAEYACRNSMKDNEPFCAECCADTNQAYCCG